MAARISKITAQKQIPKCFRVRQPHLQRRQNHDSQFQSRSKDYRIVERKRSANVRLRKTAKLPSFCANERIAKKRFRGRRTQKLESN